MIENFFPTSIGFERLDPPSKVQNSMVSYVDKFYNKKKDYDAEGPGHCLTGDVEGDFKLHHNSTFSWLNRQVYLNVKKYLRDLGVNTNILNIYATKAWPVVIRKGGLINWHRHQNASLSVVYYLLGGGDSGSIEFQATHSEISFLPYDFRGLDANPLCCTRCRYSPTPNHILVFPSSLQHTVTSYFGDTPRYSISYDIMITMKRNSFMEYTIPDPSEWRVLNSS